jgi:hypothetical protein
MYAAPENENNSRVGSLLLLLLLTHITKRKKRLTTLTLAGYFIYNNANFK